MRVVVAGSSGLIGTALIPVLRQSGHEVLRLVRRRPAAPDERGWNPPAGLVDADALADVDAVVNLGGAGLGDKRWSQARKQILKDSRVTPTEVLASAVAKHRIPTMISASAVGFYGNTEDRVVDETDGNGDGFLAELCQEWEDATAPASESGARVVLARTGLVLSGSGGLLDRLRPLFKLMLGGRLGSGRQYLPWISLDDEVGALQFALENPGISGAVNLTGPEPVTNSEFTKQLGAALRRPAPWIVPGFALRLALGELADETALGGQRALPKVLSHHQYPFQHPSLGSALAAALNTPEPAA